MLFLSETGRSSRFGMLTAVFPTLGNCWKAAFAFELVNTVFYFWMMVMSWQVHRDAN